ncbi:MAG: SpoIIE family protein phosphatase [Actinobacteria bacterium]|nr:SpoIIE family protein phosphatase [Actinomycetota bacterium]MBO0786306.1 SpoIIE family protein phosphatase [Actinomycetota bacterium]
MVQDEPRAAAGRLQDIQAFTDLSLSHLAEDDLLTELLERARAVLQADTATLLLADGGSGELVVAAACGLEEELRQGVRAWPGHGFVGRVAAGRTAVILDRVDHRSGVSPVLVEKGVQALLGVPLVAAGAVVGVLHVGALTPRQFTGDDAELLQLAADRAAVAVASQRARADRAAASALQRSLLPSAPPAFPGVRIAARYVPGNGVAGGDWYDVFVLPSGELGVVIGDVAGSGLAAAVAMGRMRSALRAYALETSDPAEVLARLDRKMQHFEPAILATVLYAVLDPGLDRVNLCSAGHLPLVIARPGHPAEPVDIEPGLMIGVALDAQRPSGTAKLPPGAVACFYTDGLIERPREPLADCLSRLCKAVTAQHPEAACATVMGAMVGSEQARDDIALLMIQRLPEPDGS